MGNQAKELEDGNRLDLDAAEFHIPADEEANNTIDHDPNTVLEPILPRGEEGEDEKQPREGEGDDEEKGNHETSGQNVPMGVGLANKKKRSKKKSKSKRGLVFFNSIIRCEFLSITHGEECAHRV